MVFAMATQEHGRWIEFVDHFPHNHDRARRWVKHLREKAHHLGINVQVNIGDPDQLWEKFLAGDMESMYTMHCNNTMVDADYCSGLHFDSTRRGLYYHSPETDAMLVEGAGLADRAERERVYHELAATLHEEAPVIFLWELNDVYGINNRVQWEPRSDERIWLFDASLTE